MQLPHRSAALFLSVLASCASTGGPEAIATVEGWGSMREVLREGNTEGRVRLEGVVRPGTWGIGALENLEGEITIVDGIASLAIVEDGELTHRTLGKRDEATLLVLTSVQEWTEYELPEVRTLGDLGYALSKATEAAGFDAKVAPVPVRIEGPFEHIGLHVLDHSCPIANPDGPPPWRWSGTGTSGTIVGVYVEGQGGVLTHHGQDYHLHAAVRAEDGPLLSGHLEEIALGPDVRLYLPASAGEVTVRTN